MVVNHTARWKLLIKGQLSIYVQYQMKIQRLACGLWTFICLTKKLACVRLIYKDLWDSSPSIVSWVKAIFVSASESEQTLELFIRMTPE